MFIVRFSSLAGAFCYRQMQCHAAYMTKWHGNIDIFYLTFAPLPFADKKMENTTDNDIRFMKEAIKEAVLADGMEEIPVGAVIVCNGKIIARAHNLTERLTDTTSHAETQAITMATAHIGGKYLTGCTIYVTLEPCPMCAAALNWAQVSRIVYGASDPKRGYSLFSPSLLHPKTTVTSAIMEQECATLITDFFKRKRN